MIGVFGGTFDPPHIGHLILADEARASLGLERVLWVVTGLPPHKPQPPQAPLEARLEMVAAAIAGDEGFELSRADVDRPPPHYALGTLTWLSERWPGHAFAYLMGSDSLADLPRWHRPAEFLEACAVLGVMVRPGRTWDMAALENSLPGLGLKCRFFEAPQVGVSARDIRRRVAEGAPYRYLIPRAVMEVIRGRGLYPGGS